MVDPFKKAVVFTLVGIVVLALSYVIGSFIVNSRKPETGAPTGTPAPELLEVLLSFEDVREGRISDDSGNGNAFRLRSGTSIVSDSKNGEKSLRLGEDRFVEAETSDALNYGLDDDFSFFTWIKTDATGALTSNFSLLEKVQLGDVVTPGRGINFLFLDGRPRLILASDLNPPLNRNSQLTFTTADPIVQDASRWNHIGFTYEGSTRTVVFYSNGEPTSSVKTGVIDGPIQVDTKLKIQGLVDNTYLDDVRIYSRALPETDVKALYLFP